MSSYVFMRVLESAAHRYDRGMRLLSRGRIDAVYAAVADLVAAPGRRILDVGCGTGGVAIACAERGAQVVGIDRSAEMLAVAGAKTLTGRGQGSVEWIQLGAAEIEDRFGPGSFDGIVACLLFSELSGAEQDYCLEVVHSRLRPGGDLVIADEVLPATAVARLLYSLRRLPLAVLTYALTQTTTRAVSGLADRVRAAGFVDVREDRVAGGAFAVVHGRRAREAA
jgi:demethylmenaquinone methyltransferase/2-methoxy-6-polyprenyl-1,4-benzoquinol methylase